MLETHAFTALEEAREVMWLEAGNAGHRAEPQCFCKVLANEGNCALQTALLMRQSWSGDGALEARDRALVTREKISQCARSLCFVIEVLGPGLLVVKHRIRTASAKFQNVAVFEGEQVKILSRQAVDVSDGPALLRSLLAPESSRPADDEVGVLLRLAVSMRAHKRGGALLVVPAGTKAWQESIVHPIAYAVEPPFTELADLLREAPADGQAAGHLGRVVDAVAGLTAVDGATLITDRYELLAFGVKIGRPDGRPRVERVVVTEPIEGGTATMVAPVQLGGTRHFSAAQFAQDQPDAVALVASQDGRFTLFSWSPRERMVHALRLETLLL